MGGDWGWVGSMTRIAGFPEQASGHGGRKAALRAGTAMLLVFVASVAHAQCVNPGSGGNVPSVRNPTIPVDSTISGVQSLVSVLTTQNTAFLTQTSGFIGAPGNPMPDLNGGGVWVRGVGGTFDTNTPGSYTLNPSQAYTAATGSSAPQTGNCNIRTFQDYGGFQAGADISRLNIDGYNIHAGVTMGYTESSIRSNGAFRADFQTPFVGVYGAITKGSFFADGQVRWDFYQGLLNDQTNTLTNQRLDARSTSITGNVGYQIPMSDGWFIEPSAGAVYSEVKVDRLQIGGAYFLAGNPNGYAAPLSVKIRDFDSLLGRASLRFGKNIQLEQYALQPFVTASVINEFGGTVRTDISTDFASFGALFGPGGAAALAPYDTQGTLRSARIGTYGQFSAGVAGQVLNTGWLGYVRGDYRTGDRVEGWGISGGLRYQFNPEARQLITKNAAPAFASLDGPVTWTGFSVGGSVGGLWSQTRQDLFFPSPNIPGLNVSGRADPHTAGVYAGGQIGADYQIGQFVFGVAGDAGFTNSRGGRGCSTNIVGNVFNCQSNIDDLYTATARVGYAVGRTLFYAKGGGAFANTSEAAQNNFGGQPLNVIVLFPDSHVKSFSTGWTLGGGFEYALTKNWSAKAEYLHFELGKQAYTRDLVTNSLIDAARHSGDIVKVGVNYRFNADPAPAVTAKY